MLWYDGWERLVQVACLSAMFFIAVVLVVRIAGKRTTGNMNNFDWIVTVAIGSLASSGILLENVAVVEAMMAVGALTFLQWVTAWLSSRVDWVADILKPKPTLLVHKGSYLPETMLGERVTEAEVDAVLRSSGYTSASEANWVILETNGTLTVIPRQATGIDEAGLLSGVATPSDFQGPRAG